MHFFHPIQQCAQQVYHTALPLSPTSSSLQKSYPQNVADDQLSHVTAFIGAPSTWGLLLRTIDTRPRKLTCIATSRQEIIAACGDIVNTYDAVTGVLKQSLSPPEPTTKIQASPDGSTLFFAHSSSVTMWDVQTGGFIHTFTTQPVVNDIAVSTSGDYIACGSSDGSVRFWNTCTKREGKAFRNSQPVVAICWSSPQKLAIATQNTLCIHSITAGGTLDSLSFPNCVWGMVYLADKDEFLVGTLKPGPKGPEELSSLETISHRRPEPLERRHRGRLVRQKICQEKQSPTHPGQLMHPTRAGKEIACITLPTGVQPFDTTSYDWINNPPLLNAAASVAISLNRNLVAQTEDSIQIFSTDVLTSGEAQNGQRVPPGIYPLGESYIICVLQPTKHLALLELETLRELSHDDKTLPFGSLLTNGLQSLLVYISPGIKAVDFYPQTAMWLGISLLNPILISRVAPRLWCRFSPTCTKILTVKDSLLPGCQINDAKNGDVLAKLVLCSSLRESVCGLTFDSETRFYLEIDGPEHVLIPYDITASPSDSRYPYMITEGEAIGPSEFRTRRPYTLDANCEWVLDAQSRKICWISPGNLRRGDDSHFWIGSSLFMVGDDGVVRKVSFREPDC